MPAQASGPSQPASSPGTDAIHRADLRDYLIAAPAGSHAWPKPLGTDRKLSLSQTANLGTNHAVRRKMLTENHFARGAVQCWITKNGTWVDVRIYQFGSAAAAQNFFRTDLDSSARAAPSDKESSVSGVPGARLLASPKPDHDGYISLLVLGVKGDVTFLVDVAEHSSTAQLALPDRLMRAQYKKL